MHAPMSLTLAALLVAGCSDDRRAATAESGFPLTVNNCTRQVTIQAPPERVLTIGTGGSTLVAAAGGADRIVARAEEGGGPVGSAADALSDVPQIAANANISREIILTQRPDLIIGYPLDDIPASELPGIPWLYDASFCYEFGTAGQDVRWAQLYADIELYGRIFGTPDVAARTVADFRQRVAAVEERFRDAPARTVAVVYVSKTGLQIYGKESVAHTQVSSLGLTDLFGEQKKGSEVSFEELLARNPDVIVAAYYGPEGVTTDEQVRETLRGLPGLDRLTAVAQGRIIALEATYIESSALNVDGLEHMADRLASFFP